MTEMDGIGRVLVAGVGYTNLQDLSLGPAVVAELRLMEWPPSIEIDDLSFGPIAAVHRFQDTPNYYGRVVLISAVGRDRQPGQVYSYRWDRRLPDAGEIQARIGEAVTGVISLDNLLIIGGFFDIWPDEVAVVEVEPCKEDWGEDLSDTVRAAIPIVVEAVQRVALGPLEPLPTGPARGASNPGGGIVRDEARARQSKPG